MAYIVHGATGAQGSPVLSALAAAGLPAVAAVRDTSKVDGEVVAVDLSSVESLAAAYEGADGVFVHLPLGHPDVQRQQALVIGDAVRRARPQRVVFSTSGYTIGTGGGDLDAPNVLVRELASSGVSYAIVEPRLYLENLLLPPLLAAVHEGGVLPYPLRADYATSWSSHLDVAEVVVRLLQTPQVTGIVSVGALPGLVGADLAAGFSRYLDTPVSFRAIAPEEMGEMISPLFGEAATTAVVESYRNRAEQPGEEIPAERSAQKLLGLSPRSVEDWLRARGV